jgi:hypothetical protein
LCVFVFERSLNAALAPRPPKDYNGGTHWAGAAHDEYLKFDTQNQPEKGERH